MTGPLIAVLLTVCIVKLHAEPSPAVAPKPVSLEVEADGLLAHMNDQVQDTHRLQSRAKDDRDSLKVSCIDYHLLVGKSVLNSGEDEIASLRAATHDHDDTKAARSYRRIALLAEECDAATKAAGTCSGAKEVGAATALGPKPGTVAYRPKLIDDPTNDCNVLGMQSCQNQAIEYVAWSSPFTPN